MRPSPGSLGSSGGSMTVGPAGRGSPAEVLYLSTLHFPQEWLDDLRKVSPRLRVIQRPCESADEIAADVWREVQILHTSHVIPDPARAPRLAWVQLDTSGVDHITDRPIWRDTTVPITTIGGVSARWIAEYVVMMMLAFSHRLPSILEHQKLRTWPEPADRWSLFSPAPIAGATVAIIGFGRIGRATGTLCAALGMRVIGVRRATGGGGGARPADPLIGEGFPAGSVTEVSSQALGGVLPSADVVVVTVPLTPHTRGLLDRPALESLKLGAVLVNVSRGGVVDEQAAAELLERGHLAAAVFDVFGKEPLPAEDPLWNVPNLIITPHVAGFAGDYSGQVKALVVENIRRFLGGEPLLNVASRSSGY
jgi:phosphoglycerate dehydrogenase-like enzyme